MTIVRGVLWWSAAALVGIVALVAAATLLSIALASVRERDDPAQAAPSTGRYVRGGDIDVFIQEAGPAAGPAVVLVHGTGAWSESWRESMVALAEAGFHAVALDLPPFGYSQRPSTAKYDRAAQAARIVGVLESLQLRRAVLVGHSFGAGATAEAAIRATDRLAALVLVDAALAPQTLDRPPGDSALLTAALAVPPFRYALAATTATNPLLTRSFLKTFVKDPSVLTDARVRLYQQPLSTRGTTVAVAGWLPELFRTDTTAATHTRAAFAALRAPILLIWGEDDAVTPLSDGRQIAALIPGAELAVLPGIGHIPQVEDAPAFNRALLRFLVAHRAAL